MEFLAAGLGFLEAGFGLFGAHQQRQIDRGRVELQFEANLEDIRRRKFEQEQTQGAAKAISEAAGVLHTGTSTPQGFLDTMAREFKKEIDFMERYAREAKQLGMQDARLRAQTGTLRALTGGIGTYAALEG